MDDGTRTITRINELVAEQHRLRVGRSQGHPLTAKDQRQLSDLSRRYFGLDPNGFGTPA